MRAAQWLSRRDQGDWTDEDQIALQRWLDEATSHTIAFLRLEAAWSRADRFKALGAGFRPGRMPTPEEFNLSPFFFQDAATTESTAVDAGYRTALSRGRSARAQSDSPGREPGCYGRRAALYSVGPALLVVCAVAGLWWHFRSVAPEYMTPVGGTASIPMTDGSSVILNTDSAVRVSLTHEERRIRLEHGEAFFEVAHDPRRPFVVEVGDKRVIAVGTQFSVRRVGSDLQIQVAEGKVRVEGESVGAEASRTLSLVSAGDVASTEGDTILVRRKSVAAVAESLSWRTGFVVFHDDTLADAVAELNRYNSHKIVIRDAEIAALRLSGKFRSSEYAAFVRLLVSGFAIEAQEGDDETILRGRNSR